VAKKKRSLGRDPFEDAGRGRSSNSVERLIKAKPAGSPGAKEMTVNVKLTPSNIKHLDEIRARLAERGKGELTRNDLIRIAIALLSAEDI
jgi:hypothetical protein